jgi:hypothetical protein
VMVLKAYNTHSKNKRISAWFFFLSLFLPSESLKDLSTKFSFRNWNTLFLLCQESDHSIYQKLLALLIPFKI